MIFVTDTAGRRVYTSVEWTALTGQEVAAALGRGWLDRVHAEDRVVVEETVDRAIRHAAEFSVRHRLLRPDGTSRWVGAGGVPSFGLLGNALVGYVGTVTVLAEGASDTITAYGSVERFRPPRPHPATTPSDALDLVADHLIMAHSLIEGDGGKDALPDVRKALFKVGQALAARIPEKPWLN